MARTRRTSGAATQQPPGRGRGRGAAASSGAIAAAAANAAASAATGGVVGEILDVELNSDHAADIRDTTNHEMDDKTENSGMSTRHRCQVEDPNGKYMYRNNGPNVPPTLICGKAFCVFCMDGALG